jgi:hypothetical protein
MSQHCFGIIKTRLPLTVCRRLERIAEKHGADFVWTTIPGTGWQGWFTGPNVGFPFTRHLEDAVRNDIEAAGLTGRLGWAD